MGGPDETTPLLAASNSSRNDALHPVCFLSVATVSLGLGKYDVGTRKWLRRVCHQELPGNSPE